MQNLSTIYLRTFIENLYHKSIKILQKEVLQFSYMMGRFNCSLNYGIKFV